MFESALNENTNGQIQIDDVFVNIRESCPVETSCDFEDSTCNWTPYGTNSFNFLRLSPQQLQTIDTVNLELTKDTTLSSKYGKFLWVGDDYYRDQSGKSMIISETLLAQSFKTREACLTFMYYMNGSVALSVYKREHNKNQLNLIWSLSGGQGPVWKMARIPFYSINDNFDLVLETSLNATNRYTPTLAIDDVFLSKSDCTNIATTPSPLKKFDCGDNTTVSEIKVCDFIRDCDTGLDEANCADCNFENSTCQWVDISTGVLKWERLQAASLGKKTGPQVDHTQNNVYGWFMFVDALGKAFFDDAHLILNRDLQPCGAKCEIEFYYHLMGGVDTIKVFVLENYPSFIETQVFNVQGGFENEWRRGVVRLGRISKPFRLMFTATLTAIYAEEDIAIDDIRMINCEFPPCNNFSYFQLLEHRLFFNA